jgi:hypothetical protein
VTVANRQHLLILLRLPSSSGRTVVTDAIINNAEPSVACHTRLVTDAMINEAEISFICWTHGVARVSITNESTNTNAKVGRNEEGYGPFDDPIQETALRGKGIKRTSMATFSVKQTSKHNQQQVQSSSK